MFGRAFGDGVTPAVGAGGAVNPVGAFMERHLAVFSVYFRGGGENHLFVQLPCQLQQAQGLADINFNYFCGVFDIMFYPHNSGQVIDNIDFHHYFLHFFPCYGALDKMKVGIREEVLNIFQLPLA